MAAQDTAHVGDGIDDGAGDLLIAPAAEIGDGRAAAAGCRNGAAKGRKAADVMLLMDGDQVADEQCAVQGLPGDLPLFGVFDHRKGDRHALVPAAGVDDHRKGAASHTCLLYTSDAADD